MSTNFYLQKRITQADKDQLIDLINNDKWNESRELLNELTEYIHIGKRAAGWKFKWNAHKFKYFEPSKESLCEWLKSGIILDEYGNEYSFEEFWKENESFINDHTGYDLNKWYLEGHDRWFNIDYSQFMKPYEQYNLNINKYGEFYIDDLRFTIDSEWC